MQESKEVEPGSARDFVERELRANPDASYQEVQVRASRAGIQVARFLYGSMRRALGLPPRSDAGPPTAQASTPAAPAPLPKDARAVDAAPGANTLGAESPAPGPDPEVGTEEAADAAGDPQTQKGSAFNFAVETLRMTPEITYQDLKARAAMAGLSMPPIVYGRAKALLGLVPTRPRRSKSEAPRILRQVDTANDLDRLPALDGIRSIEQLVATVRALEQERVRLRAALAAIQDAVGEALTEE